jgi:hypothetical protein
LRSDGVIALFEIGQGVQSELDRQRCDSSENTIGDGAV